MARTKSKTLSLVVPCFNEADVLPEFLARVRNVAQGLRGWQCEFLFVDDGSQDATPDLLTQEAAKDPRVRVIRLSRNFGHQRAISAGTDFCTGDAIVITDADLQDPPELIPDILRKLEEGHDIVHMVRSDRRVDGLLKRTMAHVFYRAMRRWVLPELPENAGDFKGFNRHVLVVLRAHRERVRFMRGAFATMGFRQTQLRYVRAARHAGQSKYPLRSTLRLARDAVFSNSALPMRPGIYAGAFTLAVSCLTTAGVLLYAATGGAIASPLLIALLLALLGACGMILMLLGFAGEYLKILLLEVKQRPLYIIRETCNIDMAARAASEASPEELLRT